MTPRRLSLLLAVFLVIAPAEAGWFERRPDTTEEIVAKAFPVMPDRGVASIGTGIGVIFSPDLSVPGNCRFYQALGFACFDDADWTRILDGIARYNREHAATPIRTLLLETHGTNGNGLKVQVGKKAKDDRSYISVGALQERVEPLGIKTIVISACNSGRLLRPMIVRSLDPNPGDKLFLPATCGIINASWNWNPRRSRVTVVTPANSRIETAVVGKVSELAPVTRRLIAKAAKDRGVTAPKQFAISDMLIQILLRDSRLALTTKVQSEVVLSKEIAPASASEALFQSFVNWINSVAASETPRPPKVAQKRGPAGAVKSTRR